MLKNKKVIFYSLLVFLLIIILFISLFLLNHFKEKEEHAQPIKDYIPQEELSDTEIRKTIISLYFKNIENNSLIAEAKAIDVKDLYKDPYSYLMHLLIIGPESEKLESAIPEGTIVNSCTLKGNIVYVDLSKEFIENAPSGIDEESMIIYSIVNTLTELNEVSGVKFLINGEENQAFKDNKITFKDAFVKND